jgi:hypothetical protein
MKTETKSRGAYEAPPLGKPQLRRRRAERIALELRNNPLLKLDLMAILDGENEIAQFYEK